MSSFICDILLHRSWNEVGDQPLLWENFNLHLLVDMTDPDHQPFEHLFLVLSLKRFQSLQHLSLRVEAETWVDKMMRSGFGFNNGTNSVWVDCADLLHIVGDKHPTIRKLSLEFTTDGSEDKMAELAEELIMFQEVDLSKCKFGSAGFKDSDAKDSTGAFLKALLSASAGPTSKLKSLTISDVDMERASIYTDLGKACSEALDEARTRVIVNIVDNSYWDGDDDSYDDDSHDDDSYDEDDDDPYEVPSLLALLGSKIPSSLG